MRSGIANLAVLALLSCTSSSGESRREAVSFAPDTAVAERASLAAYDALLPALDTIVSETWDNVYGHSLRLDRRAFISRRSGSVDSGDVVSVDEARRWVDRGIFTGVCPSLPRKAWCEADGATLVVQLSPVSWYRDSARVELLLYASHFGSTWEIWLARIGPRWLVKSRRMTMIT